MITVRSWTTRNFSSDARHRGADTIFWFKVTGHAVKHKDDTEEGVQVCAAVSTLLMTLYALEDYSGFWGGDGSGEMEVYTFNPEWAFFAYTGIVTVNNNHPGHIELERLPEWYNQRLLK